TFTFTSKANPTLNTDVAPHLTNEAGYTLVANPNTAEITVTEGNGAYYYQFNGTDFKRQGGTQNAFTIKAFESFIVATGIAESSLRSSFSVEEATALPTISGDDPVIRTEYYNLQGQKYSVFPKNGISNGSPYIERTITKSGKITAKVVIK
ncbi:MAG: hypothetical protein LBR66_09745, partial [Candidatus Symbiothrix sp.]|nr:hypothetical protein [Candidatus Symbiothrix sp.]